MSEQFAFLDPGELVDGELSLRLTETRPADPSSGRIPAYFFALWHERAPDPIGNIDLRVGNTHHIVRFGGHLGYGVEPVHRGHGFAGRACKLLLPLARDHGLEVLWITCNPDNIASRRTCERIGAKMVEIVDLPTDTDMYKRGERQKCRYRLEL